jgi:16S rRNA (uracil1498-N3)-methyltransferase
MKLHRFFIAPSLIRGKEIVATDKDLINQLKNVLRLKNGDEVLFLDGSGKEYKTVIKQLSNSVIDAEIVETLENKNEPELKITLYQSLCKKDKFEWILQKGTEVGISAFAPIITERTEKTGLNVERAEKILKEAAEQSERGIIPKLFEIEKFGEVIKRIEGEKILLDRSGENIKTYTLIANRYTLSLFVGPEGGWTEEELKLAKNSGAKIISLGPRVLRTETAGMVSAAILLNK